jgi:putative NADH-flavin reductase
MRLAVFGANGRTGRLVVEEANRRGMQVAAVMRRPPETAFPDGVAVIVVNPAGRGVIAGTVAGTEAVVSALGPVAMATQTEISDLTTTIVRVLEAGEPRRLILPANVSVFSDADVTGRFANVAAEHRRNVATARASDLDWTVVAPATLTDEPPTGRVVTAIDAKVEGRTLTRRDFAATMLDAIEREDWVHHVVGAANADRPSA